MESPVGPLRVTSDGASIIGVGWGQAGAAEARPELEEACAQLAAYFEGRLQAFDLPLAPEGSEFQREVCAAMLAIPWGETREYGDIAKALGVPAQAVGGACGGNSIPVIIPCHRVLGAAGLGGYSGAGGIETKVWLLRHEGAAGLLL
ncbi:Methylated-DNA--protein-cysteine methyltransferase [Roseovarius sp. THAF27]|uniref:methylated-DNA--[protein]-cysteine S-methyltransferase n=1 Tax=Roseovarius sp. THAF8 TaxID=2587846 RepID=UPI001268DA5A|nr:methylated-DNA--[protein]-cysteine S-methyltransferase [Roseovarius sp. THAF8]QFT79788.1 Methylated-DNA--protein-cysteine methyltransferase [Roseovarius sp. THAF27]